MEGLKEKLVDLCPQLQTLDFENVDALKEGLKNVGMTMENLRSCEQLVSKYYFELKWADPADSSIVELASFLSTFWRRLAMEDIKAKLVIFCHQLQNLDFENFDAFTEGLKNVDMKRLSMEDIRSCVRLVNNYSVEWTKKDPENKFMNELAFTLREEERARPVIEQFPYARMDLDKMITTSASLVETSTKLAESASQLNGYMHNRSTDFEKKTGKRFKKELQKRSWDVIPLSLTSYGNEKGCIVDQSGGELIQWDLMFAAVPKKVSEAKPEIESEAETKPTFFVCEVKQTAHLDHIFGHEGDKRSLRKSLKARYLRTREFLQNLPKGWPVNGTDEYRRQCLSLQPVSDYELTPVYICSKVPELMKAKFAELGKSLSTSIWVLEADAKKCEVF